MINKLLITSMVVILASLGTVNAQTNGQPIPTEEIPAPLFFLLL